MEEEDDEGEDDDDEDVAIVELDAEDVAVMQHAASAPKQAPGAGSASAAVLAAAANRAAAPIQVPAPLHDSVVVPVVNVREQVLSPLEYGPSAVAIDAYRGGEGASCNST